MATTHNYTKTAPNRQAQLPKQAANSPTRPKSDDACFERGYN